MSDYAKITLQQDLEALEARLKEAKKNGSYAGREANWDHRVVALLTDGIGKAKANAYRHSAEVEAAAIRCKDKLKYVERQFEEDWLDPEDFVAMRAHLQTVLEYVEKLATLRGEYATAMADGFRGGWPETAKRMLSDPSWFVSTDGLREAMIEDDEMSRLASRCRQYAIRAGEFLKQTEMREKGFQGAEELFQINAAEPKAPV